MKLFKFIFVLFLCIYTEATQEDVAAKPGHVPIGSNGSITIPPSSPKPITEPTNTPITKPPTTPVTKPSTTPTTKPPTSPTTTQSTTVTPTTTKSTTTAPTSTTSKTTSVPSTTAQPTSTTPSSNPDKPTVGTWNVTKPGTDIKCIMAKMELQIEVDYEEKNTTKKAVVNVPANATANGTCDSIKTNSIVLQWTDGLDNFTDSITFDFVNNTNTSEVAIDFIQVVLNGLHAPNETEPMKFFYNRTVFNAPLKHSYKCKKDQPLPLINFNINSTCKATLTISQLQIEAFRTTNSTDFGDAIDCISSTPDIVPIAVGCALAALVVVVLLAYLYGRRRSQARGYLSMFAETKQEEDYIPMKTLSCFR